MEFFESSGSLTVALGKTLVHSLWIGLLLLSILKITLQAIPSRYSNLRYRLATITLFLFMTSVVTLFLLLFTPVIVTAEEIIISFHSPGITPLLSELSNNQGGSSVGIICTISSYVYLSGLLIMLIRSFISLKQIYELKKSGLPLDEKWHHQFLQLKRSIGVSGNVGLLESSRTNVPALIGLLKPVILVPTGMFTHLSMTQVETILMHELYHLRRLDFLINLIQLAMESLFFYNPAVWAISQMIRTERENCCDDRVIQSCRDPVTYASALFQLAEHHHTLNNLVPGALGTNQTQLFNRIKRILNQTTMKTNIREKLFSLLLMAGGVIILLTISGFSSEFSMVKYSDSKPAIFQDTIPTQYQDASDKIDQAKKEALKALEEINWEEIKKDMEFAKQQAMESIDWEKLKVDMAETRVHVDSIMQDFDFDFDFDFDIDMEEIEVEMEEVMRELEEVDWEEIRTEMENVRIQFDSVLHSN